MRDEDLDWEIYHALPAGGTITVEDLAKAGYDPVLLEASLARLEKALLIERRGDVVRPLSLPESLLLCQVRNDQDSPLCFEKGILRVRDRERKG